MSSTLERVTENMKTLATQSRGNNVDGVIQLLEKAYSIYDGFKGVKPYDETFSKEDHEKLRRALIGVVGGARDINRAITDFTKEIEDLDKVLIALKAGGHPTEDLADALDTLTERARILLCNRLK